MGIVERVAELLGPIVRTDSKPARPVHGAQESGLIERLAGEGEAFPDSGMHGSLGAPREDKGAEAKARVKAEGRVSRTSRTLRVDEERLRRQSMIAPDGQRSHITEVFRRIKRQILANVDDPGGGAPATLVMITSALEGEGKTFCSINLALSIAMEMDRTVLLVDADVAKPDVPEALGVDAERGLMNVLLDRADVSEVLCRTSIDKLALLPAGTAHKHATELLASDAMRALLREMASRYRDRIIIFDSPPLLAASEAAVLASQMGQIVMVVEAGRTTEAALKDALSRIDTSKITGLLLNKGRIGKSGHYGGYGYGYGYGAR